MPKHSFDVFDLHSRVMKDYKSFVSSFVHIKDERIKEKVEKRIEEGEFWPDPLIRFNPAYEIGGDAESLVQGKRSAELYKHLEKTKDTCSFNEAFRGIKHLRHLNVEMDQAVLAAYGWNKDSDEGPAVQMDHDFSEVDYLPENDRIRFTTSPEARREVLSRLLALNHKRHAEEAAQGLVDENGKPTKEGKRWLEQRGETTQEKVPFGKKQMEFDISMPGEQKELF